MEKYIIKNKYEAKRLLILATLAGQIMLKNGAEIYRVEDTVLRICQSKKNIKYVNAFVIPTGIFISIEYEDDIISYIKKINYSSIDLNKVDMVNEFSRKFVNGNIELDEGVAELKFINKLNIYPSSFKNIFGALACSFFSLMFGGSFLDALSTLFSSFIALSVISNISKYKLTFFLNNIIGSIIISILAIVFFRIGIGENLDIIIIGSIMCLVPGVAITNSIRDTMSGDYLSGLSRGIEAIFAAISIALGVGILLSIYSTGVF